MSVVLRYVLVCLIGYLLGSISTGLTVAKLSNGPDLRRVGSKNTGASNVLRTMGTRSGLITFIGDCGKAIIACLIGLWTIGLNGAMAAGLAAVIGHNWPVYYHFKGGKGVAASCGVMIVCFPIPAIICYAIAAAVIALTRFISLGSMILLISFTIAVTIANPGNWLITGWALLLALLCILRHRTNIGRLIHGTERKIGEKA